MNPFEILIIDDESGVRSLLVREIEDFGYKCQAFDNAELLIAYLNKNFKKVALILSDYKMAPIDGFVLREKIISESSAHKDIPFVVMTGYYTKEMAAKGMELGIVSFLDKPIPEEVLKSLLDKCVAAKQESLKDELEMIKSFLEETENLVVESEGLILALEEDPQQLEVVNTYLRYLHTIKGTAACVGLAKLAKFTHGYEDFVSLIRQGKLQIKSDVISIMLKGLDCLKQIFIAVQNDLTDENAPIEEFLKVFDIDVVELNKQKSVAVENVHAKDTPAHGQGELEDKLTVTMDVLNQFMEMSGELTVIRNSIVKTVKLLELNYKGDKDIELLNELLNGMHKITSAMQGQVASMRKVPFKNVIRPMKRLVRDVSRTLGKKVAFSSDGESVLIDNIIAKVLNNTLVHLIRNSMDHGIEMSPDRLKLGKPDEGIISLNISERGDDIYVEIKDDGKGLNAEFLKQRACEKGLYTADEVAQMSTMDAFGIIFEPGFSTAAVVTDISGRGVGMDMVKKSVEGVGGRIQIDSELGKGTVFTLILPVPKSVLIINSLLVKSQQQTFVFPTDDVREVLRITQDVQEQKILKVAEGIVLSHNGRLYPLVTLSEVLEFPKENEKKEIVNVVIVGNDKFQYAMIVDEIDEFEDVVIKPVSAHFNVNSLYAGSSLLGNGSIALILDVTGVANKMLLSQRTAKRVLEVKAEKSSTSGSELMLFSLASQKGGYCIPLNRVTRLEKFSSSLVEFTGSQMIIQYRGGVLPLINLSSSLNLVGKDNESLVQSKEFLDVVVIENDKSFYGLVVERIEDIGVAFDDINSDVIDKEGILGTVFLNDKILSVVDADYVLGHLEFKSMFDQAA